MPRLLPPTSKNPPCLCVPLPNYHCPHSKQVRQGTRWPFSAWLRCVFCHLSINREGRRWRSTHPAQTDPSPQAHTSDRRQPCTQTLWSESRMFSPSLSAGEGHHCLMHLLFFLVYFMGNFLHKCAGKLHHPSYLIQGRRTSAHAAVGVM